MPVSKTNVMHSELTGKEIIIPETRDLVCNKCAIWIARVEETKSVACPKCGFRHSWITPSTSRRWAKESRQQRLSAIAR